MASDLVAAEDKAHVTEASPLTLDAVVDEKEAQLDLSVPGQEEDKVSKLENILRHEVVWLDKLNYDPEFEACLIQEDVLKETWASKIREQPNKRKENRKFLKFLQKFKSSKLYDALRKALTDTSQEDLVECLEGNSWDDADSLHSGKMYTQRMHSAILVILKANKEYL